VGRAKHQVKLVIRDDFFVDFGDVAFDDDDEVEDDPPAATAATVTLLVALEDELVIVVGSEEEVNGASVGGDEDEEYEEELRSLATSLPGAEEAFDTIAGLTTGESVLLTVVVVSSDEVVVVMTLSVSSLSLSSTNQPTKKPRLSTKPPPINK